MQTLTDIEIEGLNRVYTISSEIPQYVNTEEYLQLQLPDYLMKMYQMIEYLETGMGFISDTIFKLGFKQLSQTILSTFEAFKDINLSVLQKMDQIQDKKLQLECQKEEMDNRMLDLNKINSKLQQKKQSLQEQLETNKQYIANMQQQKKTLQKENYKLQREHKSQIRKVLINLKQTKLKESVRDLQIQENNDRDLLSIGEFQILSKQKTFLTPRESKNQSRLNQIDQKMQENLALYFFKKDIATQTDSDYTDMRTIIDQINIEKKNLECQNQQFQTQKKQQNEVINQLTLQLEELKQKFESDQKTIKKQIKKNEVLQSRTQTMKTIINERDQEIKNTKFQINKLKDKLDQELQNKQFEFEKLKQKNDQKQKELLQDYQTIRQNLLQELYAKNLLKDQLQQKEQALKYAIQENQDAFDQIQKLQSEGQQLEQQIHQKLKSLANKKNKEINQCKEELENLQKQKQRYEYDLKQIDVSLNFYKSNYESLKKDFQRLQNYKELKRMLYVIQNNFSYNFCKFKKSFAFQKTFQIIENFSSSQKQFTTQMTQQLSVMEEIQQKPEQQKLKIRTHRSVQTDYLFPVDYIIENFETVLKKEVNFSKVNRCIEYLKIIIGFEDKEEYKEIIQKDQMRKFRKKSNKNQYLLQKIERPSSAESQIIQQSKFIRTNLDDKVYKTQHSIHNLSTRRKSTNNRRVNLRMPQIKKQYLSLSRDKNKADQKNTIRVKENVQNNKDQFFKRKSEQQKSTQTRQIRMPQQLQIKKCKIYTSYIPQSLQQKKIIEEKLSHYQRKELYKKRTLFRVYTKILNKYRQIPQKFCDLFNLVFSGNNMDFTLKINKNYTSENFLFNFEEFQEIFNEIYEQHEVCGENCIHFKVFLEKVMPSKIHNLKELQLNKKIINDIVNLG